MRHGSALPAARLQQHPRVGRAAVLLSKRLLHEAAVDIGKLPPGDHPAILVVGV